MTSGTQIRDRGALWQARALPLLPALAVLAVSMAAQAALVCAQAGVPMPAVMHPMDANRASKPRRVGWYRPPLSRK